MSTKSAAFGTFIGNTIGFAVGQTATSVIEVSGSLYTGAKDGYSAGRNGLTFAELRAAATNFGPAPVLPAPVAETPVSIAIKAKKQAQPA